LATNLIVMTCKEGAPMTNSKERDSCTPVRVGVRTGMSRSTGNAPAEQCLAPIRVYSAGHRISLPLVPVVGLNIVAHERRACADLKENRARPSSRDLLASYQPPDK